MVGTMVIVTEAARAVVRKAMVVLLAVPLAVPLAVVLTVVLVEDLAVGTTVEAAEAAKAAWGEGLGVVVVVA